MIFCTVRWCEAKNVENIKFTKTIKLIKEDFDDYI